MLIPGTQRCCVKLWNLCEQSRESLESYAEAQKLQELISLADGEVQGIGISGMKAVLNQQFGYGIWPRRPLLPMQAQALERVLENGPLKQLMAYELELAKGA